MIKTSKNTKELLQKKALYDSIIEKIGASDTVEGIILFSKEKKENQRNGMDAHIMLVCEDMPQEELTYLQDRVTEVLAPMSVELVLFDEIMDEQIRKDIQESGVHLQ